ncbi:cytochrome P450 [Aspergillus pseudonomiae]|uniref:Cytochrome P450 n=1 Tax=Aspergillus pseudonomiae TaxID=1506151 RepID=A0A5N6HY99_9EURO|nr:cytochrome P450 [Aspergillus pseudonomiae]KAB8259441.1 cytochrome P450 [Aspergillus pseudonomiae]KAE8404398.1 cytochrome P450 [Aspergillus pseudonomiae]
MHYSVILLTVLVVGYAFSFFIKRNRLSLPPGPPRLPLVGNLHQYAKEEPWKTYQKWHETYGPMIGLKYGQKIVIVLGNHRVTRDLLDKRSSWYSSRPQMVVADRVTKGLHIGLLPYGERWKIHRRLQAGFLNVQMSQLYRDLQDIESKQLTYEMLSTNDFPGRFHRYAASLIFAMGYGKRMLRGDEHEIQEADALIKNITEVTMPGSWLVDAFPILKCLPRCLAKWKQRGDEFHRRETSLFTRNMGRALEETAWNWVKKVVESKDSQKVSAEELSYLVGIIYQTGGDTTAAALEVFVMASVLHPQVVSHAQQELDDVVGKNRLPLFSDIPNLPYINAFVKEVLRWRPIAPLGLPHAVTQDDEYMGYLIPKGATVIPNIWSLGHDEEVFESPAEFRPERWIENPNLPVDAFGFGRRICPGRHIALNSLSIIVARLLWSYDIGNDQDSPECKADASRLRHFGLLAQPRHFKASFQVRGQERLSVIQREWKESVKDTDEILDGIKAKLVTESD